jgi:integrase/recombinase XerD
MSDDIQKADSQALTAPTNAAQFLADWLAWLDLRVKAGEVSANTAMMYTRGMKKFLHFAPNAQSTDTIREWKADLLTRYKNRSVNAWLAGVKSFYSWAEKTGAIPHNPAKDVPQATQTRQHARDVLTDTEVRKVLAMPDNPRDAAILSLMAYTAVRTVEVQRANLADLQTRQGRYVLFIQGKGHTEADDFVILNDQAEAAMLEWLAARGNEPGPLFTSTSNNNKGGRLSLRAIRGIVKECFRLAGIQSDHKTTHSLRHSAITKMLRAGLSPVKVMSVSRHKRLDTLMIYAHDVDRMDDPAENHIKYD